MTDGKKVHLSPRTPHVKNCQLRTCRDEQQRHNFEAVTHQLSPHAKFLKFQPPCLRRLLRVIQIQVMRCLLGQIGALLKSPSQYPSTSTHPSQGH